MFVLCLQLWSCKQKNIHILRNDVPIAVIEEIQKFWHLDWVTCCVASLVHTTPSPSPYVSPPGISTLDYIDFEDEGLQHYPLII